jgi:outer membrane protein, heavy metal efflux system
MRETRLRNRVVILSALILTGCQATAPSPRTQDHQSSTRPVELVLAVAKPTAQPSEPEASESSGPTLLPPDEGPEHAGRISPDATGENQDKLSLTLQQALAAGLLSNPDLVAMRGQENVSRAVVGVAETYIWNPFIQAQYFPNGRPLISAPPGFGAGQSNYYVWAMQRFELAHQGRFRTQSALAALSQVQWNVYQAELLNIAQSMRLYFAALYQKELRDLAVETARLNEHLFEVVTRRFRANLAKPADVTTAKIAARQARRQSDLAEANYQAALLALRQQLNIPVKTTLTLQDHLADFRWLRVQESPESVPAGGDARDLAAELVEGRPDVMAASAGVRIAEANYKLSRAALVPDIQAGPIYETADDGTKYLGLRLQMDVPIFNTGGPLARQRRAELGQQKLTYDQLKVRAALEAQVGIDRYERARTLAEKAAAANSPFYGGNAPELKEMIAQFQAGQVDILAVLTTQSNLLQERKVYLDLLNELAQAAANVVQATALPPHHLVHMPVLSSAPRDVGNAQ